MRRLLGCLLVSLATTSPLAAQLCPPAPLDTCRIAASTKLAVRRDAADPSRDQVKWRWTRGQASLLPTFGDPTTTSASALCLYAAGGLVAELDVGAGGQCGGTPCWRASGSGFRFSDRAAAGGVSKVLLKANAGDRAKAMLNGLGAALPDIPLPLAGPVVAQWRTSAGGACLEARFAPQTFTRNDAEQFSASATAVLPPDPVPRPSAGCGAPISGYTAGGNDGTLLHDGLTRTYGVYVPSGYDFSGATPAPVVLILHGGFGSGLQAFTTARLAALADARGVIVVYPDGVAGSLGVRTWNAGTCCGYAQATGIDDIGFIDALLDRLESDLCIDRRRVHATGMSNGAQLSHRLACDLSWRIASVAPVAGTDNTTACAPTRPVSVMHIHGTADQHSPYGGGVGCGVSGNGSTSVADTIARWQDRDDCPGGAAPRFVEGDGTCMTYGRCRNESEVVLCSVIGGGHTWPGGEPSMIPGIGSCPFGFKSETFDASARALDFFALHPMP